jgi:hypothetical protein
MWQLISVPWVEGFHFRRTPIQVLTVPMLLNFCTQLRGNRCFKIARSLDLEFGLLCMIRQPSSADTHVIWVARHKVNRQPNHPQIPTSRPSSLDYRTRHISQSGHLINITNLVQSAKQTFVFGLYCGLQPAKTMVGSLKSPTMSGPSSKSL